MPSDQVIEVSSLAAPVSGNNPAGADLRKDTSPRSLYSRIRDARKAARAAERNNLFDDNTAEADIHWRMVLALAPDALKDHSKDLEIASWLTEALTRKNGFAGLRDGFSLIRQLIENHWDNLYPLPDEDGMETRVACLTGLNGEGAEGVLIAPIRSIPITEAGSAGRAFSYWQYKQALDAQRLTDEQGRSEQNTKNGFNIDDVLKAVNESSQGFYVNLRDDVSEALNEFRRVDQMLTERCGAHDSPPTSNILDILGDTLATVIHIARDKLPQPAVASDDAAAGGDAASATGGGTVSGPIKTRADALRQLGYISQYFRQAEPHSPLSYIIEKAVRWGDMSLGDLMRELIPDPASRTTYSSLTGVSTGEE